ncbi:hypothetical protein Bca101_080913 [Brassica carinata]
MHGKEKVLVRVKGNARGKGTTKLAVNVPWAKTVDQKGQANVRACVNSDARAAILRCGLEDEEDDKVGYMVSLIDDEYPFEHNIWTGGVKAEDVKQKKVVIEDIDGSEGNQMDEPVGKEDSRTGIDSGVDRRERLATPPSPPHVDVSRGVDSTGILRLERQVQGIKDHFDLVTDGIRKDLAAAVKAIGNLERIVKYAVEKRGFFSSEEANMDDMANLRSPFRGPSPYGLQSTNLPAEGGGHVHNREERVEPLITEDGAVEKDSSPLQNAASEIPARNSPPLVPSHTPVTSIEKLHNAASEIPAGNQPEVVPSVNLGTSPGVVTDVEKAAESIQSSSSHNGSTDDNLASIVDGEGKRDIVEEDTQVNGPVRRFSKRKRQNPNKYTPEETKKKGTNKRKAETVSVVKVVPSEKVKKVTPSAGPTTKPEAEAILLVGGFNPFIPPTLSKRTAFLKAMEETKYHNSPHYKCRGSERREDVAVMKLLEVFNCTGVCDPKGVDRVVQFMVIRRDKIPSSRFDFVPSCYFTELSRHFPAFDGFKDKQEFSFSTCLRELFVERPRWFVDVDFVYSPLLISKSQWVGMIVDLPNWAIYVVDSNRACPTDSRVNDVITQISILLPHLIHRYAYSNRAMDLDFAPMPVSRLDIPFLLEQPGLTAVGALLLLEFHAVGKAVSPITLTAENVQIAAENYAIETLAMIRAKSVNKMPCYGLNGHNVGTYGSKTALTSTKTQRCKGLLFYRSGSGHEVVKFSCSMRGGDVHPGGVFVHSSGAEKSLIDTIDELRKYHGDKQGKKFRVWVDQVLVTDTAPGTWMVKLGKWEQSGDERIGCTTTVKFTAKDGEGLVWEHVEQTWSVESKLKDDSSWII